VQLVELHTHAPCLRQQVWVERQHCPLPGQNEVPGAQTVVQTPEMHDWLLLQQTPLQHSAVQQVLPQRRPGAGQQEPLMHSPLQQTPLQQSPVKGPQQLVPQGKLGCSQQAPPGIQRSALAQQFCP
jgi:hypothetical protein